MDGPVQSEASCSQFQVGTSSSLPDCRKRSSESVCGDLESPAKRSKLQYYFVLDSESELPTDEDMESEHSVQGRETDFVKDTSDTSSHSDWTDSSSAIRVEYEEYEVASTSSDQPSFSSDSTSSGTDDLIRTAGVIAAVIDDDLGLFADTSDSDSDPIFDPELPRKDFWTCVQCKNKNNNPLYRFCEKCYRKDLSRNKAPGIDDIPSELLTALGETSMVRKGFLPPRPRRRRSKKKSSPPSPPSPPCDRDQCETNRSARSASDLTVDSGYQCSEPGSPQASTSQQLSESIEGPELCITCMTRPKNGIFVHTKIAHICCCYKCALKIWKKLGRCPLCSRNIKNVLKGFVQ